MKLKRILSLALSGVLAISMLTACGTGGISGALSDRSSSFRSELNGAQAMLKYEAKDHDLNDAIYTVAGSLTEAQAKTNGVNENVESTVQQLTGYHEPSLSPWKGTDAKETGTYVKVFVFDTDDLKYDTMKEVAAAVAKVLAPMKLDADEAKADGVSYSGDVAAYKKTVGKGESAINALVVGVAITQTVESAK